VKPVDPLPTDEAYELIGPDMADHDRPPPLARLVSHASMSTRKHTHVVRHQAKPSTILSAELQKLLKTWLIKY
jgi:hypothetical protein